MKSKLIIGAIVALISVLQATAQEKKTIKLNEAIDLGIQNSKILKSDQAKLKEAKAAVDEARERKLPDAKVSGSYLRLSTANIDLKTKSNSGSGGSSGGESPSVSQAMYGLVNLSMPIYTGGKLKYGIESANFLEKATELDAEGAKDDVIQNTIDAFANLFKAKSAVALVEENLAQARQRTKDLANLEKNGLLARNDLLKAELQASNIELSLVDAENNAQLATVNMNLMLGLPVNTDLQLDTSDVVKKDDSRILDDYLLAARQNRKDVTALDYRKKAAETGVKIAKADKLPSLALTGGYVAADIPKVLTVTNALNVGLGVSYNIGSLWKTKSKVKQAEARVEQMNINQAILDDNITLQVNKSYLGYLTQRKKIEVNRKAVEQAQENYRIVKNKFDNSLATTTDLLDADVALLQARLNFTLSRADAFVAYHRLLQSTGILSTELKK